MLHRYHRYRFLLRRRARRINRRLEHHPYVMPIVIFFGIVIVGAGLFFTLSGRTVGANDARIVILNADRKTNSLPTREETVGEFLEKAEVELNEGDVVEPSLDTKIQEDNFHVNVYRAAPAVIIDGEDKLYGLSAARTPRTIAEQVGAQLYPEDKVVTEPSDDFLKDGSIGNKVVVDRATPANLNLYGTPLSIRTHAHTVGELLKEKNVILAEGDTVQPALETEITPQTQVFVTRFGTQVITTEEAIEPPSQTVVDTSLSFGTTVIRQAGAAGKKSVTYQIELQNGVEIGRKLIQEVTVSEPVTRIVARGQAVQIPANKETIMRAAGIMESDFPFVYYIINHENALWCPTRWQGQNFCPEYYQEKYPGAESDRTLGYGLCQSTPANKMAANGEDWRTNPVTQLRWCSGYATSRYGGWEGAYNAWTAREAAGHGWW